IGRAGRIVQDGRSVTWRRTDKSAWRDGCHARSARPTQRQRHRRAEFGGAGRDDEAVRLHDFRLFRGAVTFGGNDRSGMAHAATLRRGQPGHVTDDRFGHVLLDPFRRLRFLRPADFADHDDGPGFRILFEQHQVIEERTAVDRVAADADAGRYADAERLHLRSGLVTQRAGARDDADVAGDADIARHDAQHRLAGADDARAIGTHDGSALAFRITP